MNFRRLFLLLIGAVGLFYAAAFAVANPDTVLADIIIYGAIALVFILPLMHYLKVWKILRNALSDD